MPLGVMLAGIAFLLVSFALFYVFLAAIGIAVVAVLAKFIRGNGNGA